MILLANFLIATANVLELILKVYFFILIARVVISWLNADPYNPIVNFVCSATDPILYKIRQKIPFNTGALDLSPIILIAIIHFLQIFLVQSILDYGNGLKISSLQNSMIVSELNEYS